ncbi:MAG: carbamoyltransferase HypF [Acidocella sp.]|nr:carbamoyltransferase HypF [Acidocella sp.]
MRVLVTFGGKLVCARPEPMLAWRIDIGGIVQGVGFRPFVYRLATQHGLNGWVRNGAGIVEILAAGSEAALVDFQIGIFTKAPPAAKPVLLSRRDAAAFPEGFVILPSTGCGTVMSGLPPDLGPCADCLRELADPADRRYRYPFINCTQCGPRYSLIKALPYDRATTSMVGFAMCKACAAEYANPGNRRFHAEPIACPDCGPQCWFTSTEGEARHHDLALNACVAALRIGKIIAVKGVGGYHLLCDATSEEAVAALRVRKRRPDKPLAVLFPDNPALLEACVTLSPISQEILRGPARPIIIVSRCSEYLAPSVAPGLRDFGVMLADSPLHHLLVEEFGGPLVATSANRSGAPMLIDPVEAEQELACIADGFLHHNRPIERAVDDSVLRDIGGKARRIRVARGLSPLEFRLPRPLARPVLAVGGHMKSTIALGFGDKVVISPHLGELDHPAAVAQFAHTAADFQTLYGVQAELLLVDAHAGYGSTRWAKAQNLPVQRIWHHYAHASALAGEFNVDQLMLVFTWDGVGLGPDGALWGGEVLLGTPGHWQVVARLKRMKLQGGDAAAREPWRSAAALCWQGGHPLPAGLAPPGGMAESAWAMGLNCHTTSAVGRLFDGAAALVGLCRTASYEGQGPALLEACANEVALAAGLPLASHDNVLEADWATLVPMLLDASKSQRQRAAQFHGALAQTALEVSRVIRTTHGVNRIGLAGGVFQNRLLTEALLGMLQADGFTAHFGADIPCNDAGLSFGQIIEFLGGGDERS